MPKGFCLLVFLAICAHTLFSCCGDSDDEDEGPYDLFPPVCEPIESTRTCTAGPTEGVCRRGEQTCWGTNWSPCTGQILPTPETCDGLDNDCDGEVDNGVTNACGVCGEVPEEVCDEVDNDCNGETDEGFSHIPEDCNGIDDNCDGTIDEGLSKRNPCEPEGAGDWVVYQHEFHLSTCQLGWKTCPWDSGVWTECYEWIGPVPEICDGLDNDCDGEIDDLEEDFGPCGFSEEGICEFGRQMCVGDDLVCYGDINPTPEACDTLDNDCDGEVDEELVRECETACEKGIETCARGEWIDCTARVPTPELCDGIDNDCDGEVDDGITCYCIDEEIQPCMAPVCGWGLQQCFDGEWGDCEGQVPQTEICNSHDDDCDELVDEELRRECFEGDPALIGIGICLAGIEECAEGEWGVCVGPVLPDLEFCDGLDNDCDGAIDNLERIWDKADLVFALDISGSMSGFINSIARAVAAFVGALQGTEHRFALVIFGSDQRGAPRLVTPLTDLITFLDALENLGAFVVGSIEPTLDVAYQVADPANPLGIPWREDATPILVLVGDEGLQSESQLSREDVESMLAVCLLPGCNSLTNSSWIDGDPFEMFAFVRPDYMTGWRMVISAEGTRVFNLRYTSDTEQLVADLNILFREFCLDPEQLPGGE